MYYIHYDYSSKTFKTLKELRKSLPIGYNSFLDGRLVFSDKNDNVYYIQYKSKGWVLSKN